jgi:hypothetical protein
LPRLPLSEPRLPLSELRLGSLGVLGAGALGGGELGGGELGCTDGGLDGSGRVISGFTSWPRAIVATVQSTAAAKNKIPRSLI